MYTFVYMMMLYVCNMYVYITYVECTSWRTYKQGRIRRLYAIVPWPGTGVSVSRFRLSHAKAQSAFAPCGFCALARRC